MRGAPVRSSTRILTSENPAVYLAGEAAMSQPVSRLTAKSRTTIPKPVRNALSLRPGDRLAYDLRPDGAVRLRKASTPPQAYLSAFDRMFEEWGSPEDAEAYDGLLDGRSDHV